MPNDPDATTAWTATRRGLCLRCPSCGQGRILDGYLKPAQRCSDCGEDLSVLRADDGPAWATILLVGHLISPAFFIFAHEYEPAPWLPLAIVMTLVLGLTFALLPRMKGLFMALIWANRVAEPTREA
jgi:uncharacterized protein (DUF983 family)